MKYIKTYEEKEISKPQIGDWVILEFDSIVHKDTKTDSLKKHALFMSNRVGQITSNLRPQIYKVDFYDVIPGMTENQTVWFTSINNIKMFSPDKEKLEAFLAAKKYNL